VFARLSVRENLEMGAFARGKNVDLGSDFDRVFGLFPILKERERQAAGTLSGGQQQMLAIAQALMPRPRVLLLDEPSAGLAPIIVTELIRTIAQLKSEGIAIVLVEQMVGQAMTVADHVLALQHGRVVIDCPADQVDDARLHAAYLGEPVAASPTGP
jgi:branched-chain amino acid transport system ATP-binding protein